ncbi:MAG: hypothetical protein JXO22_02790 [Phycisphaerae bacterium]|nr:hypothetical protein [Phycisphaerae bacterium]
MRQATIIAIATPLMCATLCGSTGCLVINAPPEVKVHSSDIPSARVERADSSMRYKPYAHQLDRVLRQQAEVEQMLRERDWDELADELGDWRGDIRRLCGVADTSHDPALMRRCCDELSRHVAAMLQAQRNHDASGVNAEMDACAPVLDRLSGTFPLVEPDDAPRNAETMQPVEE